MADTPNRGYTIPDPALSIFPQIRDMIMDVDSDVDTITGGAGAALADPGGDGIVVRTGTSVTVARTITGTANQVSVSNGDGVAGNPTLSIPSNAQLSIAKITNLTGNGFVRTSAGDGTLSASALIAGDIPDLSGTYQPLDSDLTTIAGLTATTDNFIVSVSSAWASRTPAQVRTTLGLVIGTNVQAYDADLTTWAGITPGTGVGTALAINVGTAGAFLPNNAAGTSLTGIPYSLTGTANQVILSAATGNITFSLPQSIATTSTPQFARLGLGAAADSAALLYLEGTSPKLSFKDLTASSGIQMSMGSNAGFIGWRGNRDFVTGTIVDTGKTTIDYIMFAGNANSYHAWGVTPTNNTNTTFNLVFDKNANLKLGGGLTPAARSTTEPTFSLSLYNGTAPVGTLANGVTFYSASGVPTVMDAAGLANGLGQTSTPTFAGLNVNGTIGASANLTIAPTGDVIFNPTGNDILPTTNYDLNLGSLSLKYLTLHAAELWVETLVAQDTMATIGGRILVGPTTVLTTDINTSVTTIIVKHNEMAVGDRVYMEANGSVEFMAVTAGPTGTGPYSYTVTRNLDGSGANSWSAGDAVFNTGTTGDGFIDLYSVRGVKSASQAGPTITGWVRNSATYNDISEHWAIGNLNGLYGYGSTTYGVGLGKYAASEFHSTLDSTNGLRFFTGLSTVVGQFSPLGVITLGEVGAAKVNTLISAGALSMRLNTTQYFGIDTSGHVTLGQVATDQGNAYWNNTNKRLEFRGSTAGTVVQAYVDTTGAIVAGGGAVVLGSSGLQITGDTSPSTLRSLVFTHPTTGTIATYSGYYDANFAYCAIQTNFTDTGKGSQISVISNAPTASKSASLNLAATTNSYGGASLLINSSVAGNYIAAAVNLSIGSGSAPTAMLDVTGDILATTTIRSSGATSGVGYTTGAGGTVTQDTGKSTGVTLNKVCGTITLQGGALAADTAVTFTVTNSAVAATDVIVVQHDSVGTIGAYTVTPNTPAAGSFKITVRNVTAGSLSEAIVIRFVVLKAVTS
jgi:hypothetical protein